MDTKKVLSFLKLEGLMDHLSGYIEDRVELLKLELQEDAIKVGVKVFFILLVMIFVAFCFLFISIAVAILVNKALNHSYYGYLIIGGVYLVFSLVIYTMRDNQKIKNKIYKMINKS